MNMFRPGKERGRRASSSAAALFLAAAMALSLLLPAYAGSASTGGESTGSTSELPLVSLKDYVVDPSHEAEFVLTVTDEDGAVITLNPVTNKYPIVQGKKYKLNQTFSSTKGLLPGRYYVDFPTGLTMPGDRVALIVDIDGQDVEVGSCYFDPDKEGRFIFELSDNIKKLTKVTMTYSLEFTIDSEEEAKKFDGHINIELVPDDKSGIQTIFKNSSGFSEDGSHVKWFVGMIATKDSEVSGFPVTDAIPENNLTMHHFTEEDMENGITIWVYKNPASLDDKPIHGWVVKPGDEGLEWEESGWIYKMPKTVLCQHCGQTLTLNGNDWSYAFEYTSTPVLDGSNSYVLYQNTIGFKDKNGWGYWEAHPDGLEGAKVVKTGNYAGDHNISWEIKATLPAAKDGKAQDGGWSIYDNLGMDGVLSEAPYTNDLRNASFFVKVGGGAEKPVPNAAYATATDEFCWAYGGGEAFIKKDGTWGTVWKNPGDDTNEDCFYGQGIRIYTRCHCTQDTCAVWNDWGCSAKAGENNQFCLCWNQSQPVELIIRYTTSADDVAQANPDQTIKAHNTVTLSKMVPNGKGGWSSIAQAYDDATVTIPKTFTKTMVNKAGENNSYTAEYTITVNEGKDDLSASASTPGANTSDVVITDRMSETLFFMQDSLTITAQDAAGKTKELKSGTDYELLDSVSPHTVKIKLLPSALGPYQYTLNYRASLLVPAGSSDSTYSNSAEVSLLGTTYTSVADSVVAPQAAISGRTYKVQLRKTDEKTGNALEGAHFKLYTNDGAQLAEVTTDINGNASMSTDTTKGIIFHEHTVYYLQESQAPNGYQLDDTKHYFMFCDGDVNGCEDGACGAVASQETADQEVNPIRVIYTQAEDKTLNVIKLTNTERADYELPETAGLGTTPFVIGGAGLCVASVVYLMRGTKRKDSSDKE